jgi:hypothetical protein
MCFLPGMKNNFTLNFDFFDVSIKAKSQLEKVYFPIKKNIFFPKKNTVPRVEFVLDWKLKNLVNQ